MVARPGPWVKWHWVDANYKSDSGGRLVSDPSETSITRPAWDRNNMLPRPLVNHKSCSVAGVEKKTVIFNPFWQSVRIRQHAAFFLLQHKKRHHLSLCVFVVSKSEPLPMGSLAGESRTAEASDGGGCSRRPGHQLVRRFGDCGGGTGGVAPHGVEEADPLKPFGLEWLKRNTYCTIGSLEYDDRSDICIGCRKASESFLLLVFKLC